MRQMSCGCTQQYPGSTCERGKHLFEAANQASQMLVAGTATEDQWTAYTRAHLIYMDHLRGWWEQDVKVQRRLDGWTLSIRFAGRWIGHFGTHDESLMREWLVVRGYQQFVGSGEHAHDRLSGYYRARDVRQSGKHRGRLAEPGGASGSPSSPSHVDLKTQVTVYIALLVASIPHVPTTVERLLVQRRATALLRAHGILIGPPDEQTLRALIDESIRQKEGMQGSPMQNTQEHPR